MFIRIKRQEWLLSRVCFIGFFIFVFLLGSFTIDKVFPWFTWGNPELHPRIGLYIQANKNAVEAIDLLTRDYTNTYQELSVTNSLHLSPDDDLLDEKKNINGHVYSFQLIKANYHGVRDGSRKNEGYFDYFEKDTSTNLVLTEDGVEVRPDRAELARVLISEVDYAVKDFWIDFDHNKVFLLKGTNFTAADSELTQQQQYWIEKYELDSSHKIKFNIIWSESTDDWGRYSITYYYPEKDSVLLYDGQDDGCEEGTHYLLDKAGNKKEVLSHPSGCNSSFDKKIINLYGGVLGGKLVVADSNVGREPKAGYKQNIQSLYLLDPITNAKTLIPISKELGSEFDFDERLNHLNNNQLSDSEILVSKDGNYYSYDIRSRELKLAN